jgi:hypothetical protein
VAGVHDRMPVIVYPDQYDKWLDPTTSADEARAMLRPYDAELMKAYEVNRAVNSVKNNTEVWHRAAGDVGGDSMTPWWWKDPWTVVMVVVLAAFFAWVFYSVATNPQLAGWDATARAPKARTAQDL